MRFADAMVARSSSASVSLMDRMQARATRCVRSEHFIRVITRAIINHDQLDVIGHLAYH